MSVEKIKSSILYDIVPLFCKQVAACLDQESLKTPSKSLIDNLAKLVYPEDTLHLAKIKQP